MLPPPGDPQCIPRYLLRCHPCPLGPNPCVCPQYPLNALWFLPVPWLQLQVFPNGPFHTPHCCFSVPQDISYCPCCCPPPHPFLTLAASSSVTHIPCSKLTTLHRAPTSPAPKPCVPPPRIPMVHPSLPPPPHRSRLSLPVPGASPRPAPVPSRRIPSPGPAAARGRHGQAVRRAVPPAAARRLGRG